jgi:hypothetical protein
MGGFLLQGSEFPVSSSMNQEVRSSVLPVPRAKNQEPRTTAQEPASSSVNQEPRTEDQDFMVSFRSFEEIDAWKKARELTRSVYGATAKGAFARDYGLAQESANLAGGLARYLRGTELKGSKYATSATPGNQEPRTKNQELTTRARN